MKSTPASIALVAMLAFGRDAATRPWQPIWHDKRDRDSSLSAFIQARAEVTLVKDDKSRALIVVPAGVDREVEQAGRELQAYIEKCTGARIEIVAKNRLQQRGGSAPSPIYSDSCNTTDDVLDLNGLEPKELVIRTGGSDLFIAGGDGGTLVGVYHWNSAIPSTSYSMNPGTTYHYIAGALSYARR